MKNTKYILILICFSLKLNAQTNSNYPHIVLDKETIIEIQEAFYNQLSTNPLIAQEDVLGVRTYFLHHLITYKKLMSTLLHAEVSTSKTNIKKHFPELTKTLLKDYRLYKEHIKSHENTEKGSNNKGPGDPCTNMDFEACDYTAWELTQGFVDANPYGFINPTITTNWGNGFNIGFPSSSGGDQHFIVNPGLDPNAPIQMINPLGGGTCTSLLGDGNAVASHASRMSQIFLVDSNSANFSYSYAAVLQDPSGHSLGEKPYFQARIYDQFGNSITCGEFQSTAGDGSPGWISNGTIQYRDWSTVIVPLQAYIGQNVRVEFTVGDCSQSGHFGYAYVEASCEPLAIIPTDTIVCGAPVTLNAPSPFNGTYLWNTGQTTSSISVTTPGLYTVDLISGPGCFITLEVLIQADTSAPIANFTANSVCLGATTFFNDISSSSSGIINNWAWDFDNDGVTDNTTQNPSYTFPTTGTFPVNLYVSVGGNNCGHDTTINIYVTSGPVANFTFNNICEGATANFTDLSNPNGGVISIWNWDFNNDGIVDNNQQNPINVYPASGTYTVELFVSTASGCKDSITAQIIVNPLPVSSFSSTSVCIGDVSAFTDLSTVSNGNITNWQWNFGDGIGISSIQNPGYSYANSGIFNVSLTVTSDSGCSNTSNFNLAVYPSPNVNFSPTEVCLNGLTQFTDLSNVSNANTSNSIVQWNWNFNGMGGSNVQHPSFTFNTEGIVPTTLIVTTNHGCRDSATLNVTVNPLPVIDFNGPTTGCAPVCTIFNDSSSISSGSIVSYKWEFGDGSTSSNQHPTYCFQNPSRVASKSFDITLTATSNKGCKSTLIKPNLVTVYPIPLADFFIDPAITDVYNRVITFTDASQIASSWMWEFGDGATSSATNPIHEYADSGSYLISLFIENSFGCKDTFEREIIIRPAYAVWIPNVFTPDGDGLNDVFFIDGFGLNEIDLRIYDRWGEQIFHEIGYNEKVAWNGIYKGDMVQQDVYIYKAIVTNVFNETLDYAGKVTLLK